MSVNLRAPTKVCEEGISDIKAETTLIIPLSSHQVVNLLVVTS